MCWFITVGVAPEGAVELEKLGQERAGLGVRPSTNQCLAAMFLKDDVRFEVTHGGCSCDLSSEGHVSDPGDSKKMRRRYKAQGWSDAKIARAIGAAETARAASALRHQNAGPKVIFRNAVAEQVRRLGSVRLFAHFYSGSQDDEQVACADRRRVTEEEFLRGDLPADVLVDVIARAGSTGSTRRCT